MSKISRFGVSTARTHTVAASAEESSASSPLLFAASRFSRDSPTVLYSSNRGVKDSARRNGFDDFNLSYKVKDDLERVARHHAQLLDAIGRPLALLQQVHSATVVDVDAFLRDAGLTAGTDSAQIQRAFEPLAHMSADGQVTTRTDIALGIYTADCTPVLIADCAHGVYGAAHAGRKGVENGVVTRTIEVMQSKGAQIESLEIWLGPNICGDCYETGDAVAGEFAQTHPNAVTRTRFGGAGVDMRRALREDFKALGVPSEHVHDHDVALAQQTQQHLDQVPQSVDQTPRAAQKDGLPRNPMCTLENPLLYSYREWSLTHRHDSNGRFISVLLP
jgi:YfiH family protein